MGLALLRGAEPYHGGLVTPPLPKPRLTLTSTDGVRFDLASATEGDVTLLFFGYTHCPDVCPMHMAYLASALKRLPAPVRDRIKLVFITTDPARDDPKTLRAWLDHFDKHFIGLTGSPAEIAAAQSAAHVPHAEESGAAHAAFILAYTRDNLAHVIYPFGVSQADWLHDLPLLVKEDWTAQVGEYPLLRSPPKLPTIAFASLAGTTK
jgi:protein SCO1/2